MKIIKKKSNQTYKGKDNKDHYYYNYYLILDNGVSIQIKTAFIKDIIKLDTISIYER